MSMERVSCSGLEFTREMLMLIPAGEAEATAGGYDRLTCKGKGRTVGSPSGPPPTPKLDGVF
jgi:hypothetical protein